MRYSLFKQKFLQLWQVELVRCYEREEGNFDTSSVQHVGTDLSIDNKLQARAQHLIKVYELEQSLLKTIHGLKWVVWLLLGFACVLGIGLAQVVNENSNRELSLPWVLFALLGVHALLYLLWGAFSLGKAQSKGWLAQVVQRGMQLLNKGPKAQYCLQAFLHTLRHYRLGKLFFSVFTHMYWFMLLLAAAGTLSMLFLFQRYTFSWESTVLDSHTLSQLGQLLGTSLRWLGITLPDVSALQVGQAERQAQVGRWLIAMVLVYGCGLRLFSALLCAGMLFRRTQKASVDKQQPGISQLIPILTRSQAETIDQDNAPDQASSKQVQPSTGKGCYVVHLEHTQSLPVGRFNGFEPVGILASLADIKRMQQLLHKQPAASLAVLINNKLTPDRGNLRLLGSLVPLTAQLDCYFTEPSGDFTASWQAAIDELKSVHGITDTVRIHLMETQGNA